MKCWGIFITRLKLHINMVIWNDNELLYEECEVNRDEWLNCLVWFLWHKREFFFKLIIWVKISSSFKKVKYLIENLVLNDSMELEIRSNTDESNHLYHKIMIEHSSNYSCFPFLFIFFPVAILLTQILSSCISQFQN